MSLPNRRPAETLILEHSPYPGSVNPSSFIVTIGYSHPEGRPVEAFIRDASGKSGSLLDGLLYDIGVLLSLALQHGITPEQLRHSVARLNLEHDGGLPPASIVGRVLDLMVGEGTRPFQPIVEKKQISFCPVSISVDGTLAA